MTAPSVVLFKKNTHTQEDLARRPYWYNAATKELIWRHPNVRPPNPKPPAFANPGEDLDLDDDEEDEDESLGGAAAGGAGGAGKRSSGRGSPAIAGGPSNRAVAAVAARSGGKPPSPQMPRPAPPDAPLVSFGLTPPAPPNSVSDRWTPPEARGDPAASTASGGYLDTFSASLAAANRPPPPPQPAPPAPPAPPAALPAGWAEVLDPVSGKPYYTNAGTGAVTWERPAAVSAPQPQHSVQPPPAPPVQRRKSFTEQTVAGGLDTLRLGVSTATSFSALGASYMSDSVTSGLATGVAGAFAAVDVFGFSETDAPLPRSDGKLADEQEPMSL